MSKFDVKLTSYAKTSGWAAKVGPDILAQVLSGINKNRINDNRLVVGIETSDDAAVYDLQNGEYLITTLDFFTPIVDDPYLFGQIAAANSLSDVYAMGGYPKMAMNIVCFPSCLDPEILAEILRGGYDKIMEANCLVVGGHTVQDDEPKYGLSVNGFCKKEELITNSGAKVGDLLIMTKPIGAGIINTAIKGGIANESDIEEAVKSMSTLNEFGLNAIRRGGGANALTDITGFGIGGHLIEMMEGSDLSCNLYADDLNVMTSARTFASMGLVPKGAYDNKKYFSNRYESLYTDTTDDLVFDPETSGGLLIATEEKNVKEILKVLNDSPYKGSVIGEVIPKSDKRIYLK